MFTLFYNVTVPVHQLWFGLAQSAWGNSNINVGFLPFLTIGISFGTCNISSMDKYFKTFSCRGQGSKKDRKNSLFFISVDEFSKLICCFLFSLIFSTNSTNQRNQRNEFNESTNKIFVDFTKFQRIFNEKFNESTKISTNQRKFWKNLLIRWNVFRNQSMLWKLLLIRWKFGQFIGIFIESSSTFLQINENFIRWFVEFVDDFSNQYFFVDFVFQINEFNEINIFFSTKTNQRINIFNEKIFFLEPWSGPKWTVYRDQIGLEPKWTASYIQIGGLGG